jgi:hypothetical protein
MIDLNDVSFTLPINVHERAPIPSRCHSAQGSRRIQTPSVPLLAVSLHESLDALEVELNDPKEHARINIICSTLGAIAHEIARMPESIGTNELTHLIEKVKQLSSAVDTRTLEEVAQTTAKVVHRRILTPHSTLLSKRTRTPACPKDIVEHAGESTSPTRRFLFP